MAKRGATSELNHNNWDDEEEPEEAGVFIQADQETIQNRVIKKAKRRGPAEDGGGKTAFSGFAGLTGGVTKANTFSGFGSAPGKSTFGTFQSFKPNPTSGEAGKLFFGASSTPVQPSNGNKEQTTSSASKSGGGSTKGSGDWKDSPAYFSFLKALNLSVLSWIKQHVEENPFIILTPIFKDYEQYLKKQEAEASSAPSSGPSVVAKKDAEPIKDSDEATLPAQSDLNKESSTADKVAEVPKPTSAFSGSGAKALTGFTFGATSAAPFTFGESSKSTPSKTTSPFGKSSISSVVETTTTTASVTSSSGFSFGLSSTATSKPLFSFGTSSSTPATSGFSFGASASQATTSSAGSSNGTKEDDEYVPPKPEVREIKEDDALYSKRCKLYFQRNDQWVDKGVGNLHLKPVAENKTQLLVRADTNLGNILLNVMLSQSLPVSRQGKNNVLIVCVPNPPLDSKVAEGDQNKPVPMLIRVKTGEDADELFGKINERKELL